MEDLMKLRESIDEIDSEIVRLYKERMEISKARCRSIDNYRQKGL